jgi:hypothetical protein
MAKKRGENRMSDHYNNHYGFHCNDEQLQNVLINLIDSVAREENALAHLIKAEADKVQAFVGKHCDFPTHPSNNEIIKLNRSVTQLLESIVMKEWLLLKKLEDTLEFVKKPNKC